MDPIRIKAGPYEFEARFEEAAAPKTCAKFASLLPYRERIIHVRWSGEGCWIPLGDLDLGLDLREPHQLPRAGRYHPLSRRDQRDRDSVAYGGVRFASKVGQLAGNHFLTITKGRENLAALGKLTLWQGAQNIVFERM